MSPYCETKRHWLCAHCVPMFYPFVANMATTDLVIPIFSSFFCRSLASDFQFPLGQINAGRKRPLNISIIFGRLPSIHQTFHETRSRKLLGMQWHKTPFDERTKTLASFESCYFHRYSSRECFRFSLCQTNKGKY